MHPPPPFRDRGRGGGDLSGPVVGGSRKNPSFRGGHEKPIYRGGGALPKKGELGQFADLRGGLARKKRVVFLRGG